jgi:transposase-like protein
MGADNGPLVTGDVVADEMYYGGDPKNRHASDPRVERRGRGTSKTPIVTVIESKSRRARSRAVADVTGRTLRKAITDNVDMAFSTLHTDALPAYLGIGADMAGHYYVDHSAGEYANDKTNGTNIVECYYAQLRRSLDGTHHQVSREHLHRYLGEFDFRFSTCKMTDAERMQVLASQVDGRLPYDELVSS